MKALAGIVLLGLASLFVGAAEADTLIAASSTFPIGLDPTTGQFLSESLNGSFEWNGSTASSPSLVATGPVQGFTFAGTSFDTTTNTERGDFTNPQGDDFLIDFSFLQDGTPVVGDSFICPSCQALIDPVQSMPESSTLASLSFGLAVLWLLRKKRLAQPN